MRQERVLDCIEWAELRTPDVYFSQEYYATSGLLEPDFSKVILLEWSDETGCVRLPLILRAVQNTKYFDATSAYGYGGPWVEGDPNLEEFLEYFNRWAEENGVICTFLRFHPLLDNAKRVANLIPIEEVGPTAGWNLDRNRDLVESMSKGHRKTFRRAQRMGVNARLTVNPSRIEEFVSLYMQSMDRLAAGSFYRFSEKYWQELQNSMGEKSLLVEAVYEERVIAAAWCLFGEEFIHFHLSGTSDEGRKLGGSVVCRVAGAKWGQERGLQIAHSGGGVGGADSGLLEWKRKFDVESPLYDFYVAKIIHNNEIFAELSTGRRKDGFFPPWRAVA